jgi:DNA-binding response OmpR family regulator
MPLRILVLANKNTVRRVVNSIQESDIDITCQSDISEVLTLLKNEKFDLALVDGYMDDIEALCYRITWQCRTPIALIIKGTHADWDILRSLDVDGFIPEEAENVELLAYFSTIARRGSQQFGRVRILVIEDDKQALEYLRLSFQIYWPEATISSTTLGSEGIRLARNEGIDAILLDLDLPDISGLNILKGIRSFSQTPVIAITASGSQEDVIKTIKAGASDYIVKPFKQLELMSRIRQQISLGAPLLKHNYN